MVITVQGYNGKKNKALAATAIIAGMNAMKRNSKTLVVQLLNNDIETVEYMLGGFKQATSLISDGQRTLAEDGIDALLREVDAKKLMKDDFDNNCTQILTAENLLDVTAISGSDTFTNILLDRMEAVRNLIDNASDVYETIILLLPSNNEEIIKAINEMTYEDDEEDDENAKKPEKKRIVDKSIYCIKQGFYRNAAVYGDNICYLCMDFEAESIFTQKEIRRGFVKKKEKLFTIAHNVAANDAVMRGALANYIRKNRELTELDDAYEWIKNVCALVSWIAGEPVEETNTEWEKITKVQKVLRGDEAMSSSTLTDEELEQLKESIDVSIEEISKDVSEVIEATQDEEDAQEPEEAGSLDEYLEQQAQEYCEEDIFITPEEADALMKDGEVFVKNKKVVSPDEFSEEQILAASEIDMDKIQPEESMDAKTVAPQEEKESKTEKSAKKKGLLSKFKKDKKEEPKKIEEEQKEDSIGILLDDLFEEAEEESIAEAPVTETETQPAAPTAEKPKKVWTCSCGTENYGKFCFECGLKKPITEWTCKGCGTINKGKFCYECGMSAAENDA